MKGLFVIYYYGQSSSKDDSSPTNTFSTQVELCWRMGNSLAAPTYVARSSSHAMRSGTLLPHDRVDVVVVDSCAKVQVELIEARCGLLHWQYSLSHLVFQMGLQRRPTTCLHWDFMQLSVTLEEDGEGSSLDPKKKPNVSYNKSGFWIKFRYP